MPPMTSTRGPGDTLASNIRAELARRGISQVEVAKALGLNRPCVSRRLNGNSQITAVELVKIARLLGVSVDSLVSDQVAA